MSETPQKKPLSEGAKIALILGGGALIVLLVAVICFYSLMNRVVDNQSMDDYYEGSIEDVLPEDLEAKEFKAGTYQVPKDIDIAAYYVFASEEMEFIATGKDGELDMKEKISNNQKQALSIITEDGDSIQLVGNGTVTFIKVGEAEDYMPSNSDNQKPSGSKDGYI